jgi:hypothetical protein
MTSPSARWAHIAVLLLGLVIPQVVLYGPSLTGAKVLLPLDILTVKGVYIPTPANVAVPAPKNEILVDEVLLGAPQLHYAAKELRAGHLPLWNPQNFAGVPFASFPKYSPWFLIFCCWPHPTTLAYLQLVKSVIAGLGAYLFFRRALGVGFWAAALGAWCYPLTGFFIQWQGYGLTQVAAWLPWVLLAVYMTVRNPKGFGAPLLAIFTALALIAGQLDVAGLVLLSSGLYAVVCLVEVRGLRERRWRILVSSVTLVVGWGLGFCIAAAYVAPLIEYSRTGERLIRRAGGEEDRPPAGIAALPQIVLPNLYGSTKKGSLRLIPGNQPESSAAGYAGLLPTLLFVPLAFCHRILKNRAFWWLGLLVLSLAWVLDLPGLVQLMRMPLANMLSWNRLTMLTGFALTTVAVIGLDAIEKGMVEPRRWFAIPTLVAMALCVWCLYRLNHMPQEVLNFVSQAFHAPADALLWGLPAREAAETVIDYFRTWYRVGAVLSALTLLGWAVLSLGMQIRGWMVGIAGSLMLAELLTYAYGVNPQCDPALYYPKLFAFEALKQRTPGRILCVSCLPPDLNLMIGLPDIRGYDAVDPKRLLDVLEFARASGNSAPREARTMWFVPWSSWTDDGSLLTSPLLSMFNVRYLIWSRDLPSEKKTIVRRDGYVVVENERALPRTFVPQTVQFVGKEQDLMDRLRDKTFDAARLSYVTQSVDLPDECRGTTSITKEDSGRVIIDAHMETAGVVVLADLWDKGWRANVDGVPAQILLVNHTIRGVVVPAGVHRIVFRYRPDTVWFGLLVSGSALLATLGWLACIRTRSRQAQRPAFQSESGQRRERS